MNYFPDVGRLRFNRLVSVIFPAAFYPRLLPPPLQTLMQDSVAS